MTWGSLRRGIVASPRSRSPRASAPRSCPPLELIVRTSGEQRLSNFLLWEAAYAELVFLPVLWPDFRRADLEAALDEFGRRQRRLGLTKAS